MVRSILDYYSIVYPFICESSKKKLRAIQYHGVRIACRQPYKASHKDLLEKANVITLDERYKNLNQNYLENAFINDNELVHDLCKAYLTGYPTS